jgi:hypothetical protein
MIRDNGMSTMDLAAKIFRTKPCTESQRVIVSRSLNTLRTRGLVQKSETAGRPTLWRAAAAAKT